MSQAELLSPTPLSPSVSLHSGRPATTSLEVAKFFGKRHDNVLRDVDALLSQLPENSLQHNFEETYQEQETPFGVKQIRVFILYRDGFMLLVMGYTGKKALSMKLPYIEAFNRMEEELARQKESAIPAAPTPDDFTGTLSITPSTTEDRKPRGERCWEEIQDEEERLYALVEEDNVEDDNGDDSHPGIQPA